MNNGWILIHRKLKKKAWAKDPDYLALWIHLLLSASWEDTQFMMNRQIVNLKRGEFVAGRKSLSVNSGIGESKVYRILEFFKSEQQINIKPTNKYSIISITNYDQYQATAQQSEQQANNKRTADEQQTNTIKEVKELNEVKEEKITAKPQAVCPYQQIVDLYHECLPNNPRVVKLTGKRKSHIKSRWLHDLQSLDQWRNYFEDVSESKFLTGQVKPNGDRKVFIADIDFLINESNLTKVAERKYHDVSR